MNIMLVSVTERTREIGIRMAIGAKGRDIRAQFLIEALTLSVAGGALGIALGVAVSKIIATNAGWPILLSPGAVVLAFGFSAAIGVFFGFYPAQKAARLDPIKPFIRIRAAGTSSLALRRRPIGTPLFVRVTFRAR
jgi:putative ABC transport system permease protein